MRSRSSSKAVKLCYVRYAGREVMRAIAFIVRDEAWGTCSAEIKDLEVNEASNEFRIRYEGLCAEGAVRYAAEVDGTGKELIFAARISVARHFRTNRTGFVILKGAHDTGVALAAALKEHHWDKGPVGLVTSRRRATTARRAPRASEMQ